MKTLPGLLYGTAWKKEKTTGLVRAALNAGFRAIDTANQLKHYDEKAVGLAVQEFFSAGNSRESLFLQTKFTPIGGQDDRLPYRANSPVRDQVAESFESSLEHLGVDYVDSYLLHGPDGHPGLSESDWMAWEAIEKLFTEKKARYIGVSNMNWQQMHELIRTAKIQPHFLQNRCFARTGWDRQVRELCRQNQITYQGFSLLTANPQVLVAEETAQIAKRLRCTTPEVVFAFARSVGMLPLTGTSDPNHMNQDLSSLALELSSEEVSLLELIDE